MIRAAVGRRKQPRTADPAGDSRYPTSRLIVRPSAFSFRTFALTAAVSSPSREAATTGVLLDELERF
jgi:hypothetical protein